MKLKDACEIDAVTCLPDINIAAAAAAMRKNHVGDLIVVDDADEEREPLGIITDRDIVTEVVALGRGPNEVKVREVMSAHLVVASESEDVQVALERMRAHGVRRIPVLDDGGFVLGIVTLDDLVRIHAEEAAALAQVLSTGQRRESRTKL